MDSPIPKNTLTPIKRLGLSRKKSSPGLALRKLASNPVSSAAVPELSTQPTRLTFTEDNETQKTAEKRLQELNGKLTAVGDTSELEEAITMWKQGLKDALNDLKEIISTEEGISLTMQELAEKLGILSILQENFPNDSDIFYD